MAQKSLLVIGSGSRIGGPALQFFRQAGYRCEGTDRSTLDLENIPSDWTPPPVSTAIFCAAMVNLNACEANPALARKVNVDGTIAVLKKLSAQKIRTIFLSTNLVFSGETPAPSEDDATRPQTVYGENKAEVENWIRGHMTDYAILRIAKVLVGNQTLIYDWMTELLAGREVTPFADLSFCPVVVETALAGMKLLVESAETGPFHLSGDKELTYEQAAQTLCRMMQLPLSLVRGTPARLLGYRGILPRYSTLGMERLPQLGLERPSSQVGLENYIHSILARQNSDSP